MVPSYSQIGKERVQVPLLLYGLFLASIIVDIGGGFGVKYSISAVILVYELVGFVTNSMKIPLHRFAAEWVLFAMAPMFFSLRSVSLASVTPGVALREIIPFATWIIYPLLLAIGSREKITSYFATALFWGALLIILIFLCISIFHYLGRNDLMNQIYIFTSRYGLGYFGQKPTSGDSGVFFPNVYFRWSLLLIPAAVLLLDQSSFKICAVVLAGFLTTSTAVILFMFFALIWGVWDRCVRGKIPKAYVARLLIIFATLLSVIAIVVCSGSGDLLFQIAMKLSPTNPSTSVKVLHVGSIAQVLLSDPITFLFGMGVGTEFYSAGAGKLVSRVEVSHFDMMRQYGALYTIAFCCYVFFLFASLRRTDRTGRQLAIGLMMLFIGSGTNPLLLSPVFFLVLVMAKAYVTLWQREKAVMVKCLDTKYR